MNLREDPNGPSAGILTTSNQPGWPSDGVFIPETLSKPDPKPTKAS
jgi:hypothetical protein